MTDIAAMLAPHGLILRGGFALEPERDADLLRQWPEARQLVLIGHAGSTIWPPLEDFIDAHPSDEHPLDHWTVQTVDRLASEIGAVDLYPFGGPPWWPFQRWAQRAEPVASSPIAILIHPVYGLWHAYRAALLLEQAIDLPIAATSGSPCDTCCDRPCLTACPVGAFSSEGYDVGRCAQHVDGPAGGACRDGGCLARRACPVGAAWRYEAAHAAFHMEAFVRARRPGA